MKRLNERACQDRKEALARSSSPRVGFIPRVDQSLFVAHSDMWANATV